MDFGLTFQDSFPGIDRYRRTTPTKVQANTQRSPSKAEVNDILSRIDKLKSQRPKASSPYRMNTVASSPYRLNTASRPEVGQDSLISQLQKQHAEEIANLQATFEADMAAKLRELEVAYTDQHNAHRADFESMVSGYQAAQGDLSELRSTVKESRSAERQLSSKCERYELQIIEYQKTVDMQSKEITTLQASNKRLKKFERQKLQYEEMQNEIKNLTTRNQELKQALSAKNAQLPRLQSKLSKLKTRLTQQSDSSVLEEKLDEERKIRSQLDTEYRKLVGEISDMKQAMQKDLQSEYAEQIRDLQYQLAQANNRVNSQSSDTRSRSVDRVRIPTRETTTDSPEKWKSKATQLVTRYYDELKQLRKETEDMKIDVMKEMHNMQKQFDKTLEKIISHYTDAIGAPKNSREKYI